MSEERLLTIEEAADRLIVHPNTVRRLIKTGQLKAVKVGRLYRVLEKDLLEFIYGSREERKEERKE